MTNLIHHWVDGKVMAGTSGRLGPVYNPALGAQTGAVDMASVQEVDDAVRSAVRAQDGWRRTSLAKRATVLFNMRDLVETNRKDLAALVTAEHGKPSEDALG